MLILAGVWFAYTVYRIFSFIKHPHQQKAKAAQMLGLLCDVFLAINLLLWGLQLHQIIEMDMLIASIPITLYIIGKIIENKLK